MAKKFYDIFPPQFQRESQKEIFFEQEKSKNTKFFISKRFFLILGIFVIFGGGFASFKFSTVDLEIWPKIEIFNTEEKVSVLSNAKEINIEDKIIPAAFFINEKELWQEFSSTGIEIKKQKAEGKIRVFNEAKSALSLIKETRFLSEENKTFICPKSIFIPGNSYINVEVVAIESGNDYNISSSNFSIPGLKGTNRYFTTFGKSFDPMEGGLEKEIKKVTQEDLKNAEDFLTKKVFSELQKSLKEKNAQQFVLFDEAILTTVVDVFSPIEPGVEIEKFSFSVKGKIKAIAFLNTDLKIFSKKLFLSELDSDKEVFLESLSTEYELEKVDFQTQELEINIKNSAKVYQALDKNNLKSKILKKEMKDAEKAILENFPQISEIKMKFYPFWAKRVPSDTERIRVYWKVAS